MATLTIYDRSGAEVGSYEIDPAEIAPKINKQLMHDAVVMYQANQRLGSAKTKNRTEVAGSRQKMYRQKGTGRARAGARKTGVRRGGGHLKQILPRDYSYRLPKKAVRAATRMAIASKIMDNERVGIDYLSFESPRPNDMAAVLESLQLSGTSTLVATESLDTNVYKSGRNISGVSVLPVSDLNALAVLSPKRMLVTKSALDAIRAKATGTNGTAGSGEVQGDSAAS